MSQTSIPLPPPAAFATRSFFWQQSSCQLWLPAREHPLCCQGEQSVWGALLCSFPAKTHGNCHSHLEAG